MVVISRCVSEAGDLSPIIDVNRPESSEVGFGRYKGAQVHNRTPVLPQECTLITAVISPIADNLPAVVNRKRIGAAVDRPEIMNISIPKERIELDVTD